MKQTIRLTEGELRRMIKEAVDDAAAERYTEEYPEMDKDNHHYKYSTFGPKTIRPKRPIGESKLRGMIRTAVNEALNEVNVGGQSFHGNDPNAWAELGKMRSERFSSPNGTFNDYKNANRNYDHASEISKQRLSQNIAELELKLSLLRNEEPTPENQRRMQNIQAQINKYKQYL